MYAFDSRRSAEPLHSLSYTLDSWLIIDDLVDTGKTAQIVRDMFVGAHFATVYAKPEGRPMVDTFVTEVSQDTWVLFPWDTASATSFIPPIINM